MIPFILMGSTHAASAFQTGKTGRVGIAASRCVGPLISSVKEGLIGEAAGDRKIALEKYEKACEAGCPSGCSFFGRLLEGVGNSKKVGSYYKKACDGGDPMGCDLLTAWEENRVFTGEP